MSAVTAIVPTYNRVEYLTECLSSLLSQTRPLDRIIVVNDGSTDGTAEVLKTFGGQISIIEQENSGKAVALNRALAECRDDYIWICDDDDVADPNGLEALHSSLDVNRQAPFAYGLFKRFRDVGGERRYEEPGFLGRKEEESFLIQSLEETFAFQFAQLVRLESYKKVGPFREDLFRSQDFEMVTRLALLGQPLFVPATIFYQRIHTGDRGPQKQRFSVEQAVEKWVQFGGVVMREIRKNIPESQFRPSFAKAWSESEQRRAALLQRGLIFAQRALWPEALDDIELACTLSAGVEVPSAPERTLCEVVIRSELALLSLAGDGKSVKRLGQLYRSDRFSKSIVFSMMRAFVWNIRKTARERRYAETLTLFRCLSAVLGPKGAAERIGRSLF
jgi:glycosyltransferase involved in cell wall biosynthesis